MQRWISGRYEQDQAREAGSSFWPGWARPWTRCSRTTGRGKKVIVFTSGGPISAFMQRALGLGIRPPCSMTWVIKNASLSSFLYNQKDFSLSGFNSTTHLETSGQSELITYR